MSIYDGMNLIVWRGCLFEPGSDLLKRLKWAVARIEADGGKIDVTEAGRPFGVPGDEAIGRAGLPESRTASGRSTVYYQWGRAKAGLTPSAANPALGPNASEHTQGKAVDCDVYDIYSQTLRSTYFALVGLARTITSEPWHWAIRGPVQVDLTDIASATPSTPIQPPEEEQDLTTYFRAKSTAGFVFAGWTFEQCPDGTLRPLLAREWQARTYTYEKRTGKKLDEEVVAWEGADILDLAHRVGMHEFTGTEADRSPRALTGRIIGRSADPNNKDGSDFRHFPRSEPGSWPAPRS